MVKEVKLNDMLDAAKVDFTTGYMCSETVLDVLNRFYELGIGEEAIALSTGFPYGFGDGGNVCGAVAGATMALGKLFGRTTKGDPAYEKCIAVVRELNEDVAAAHGSSLCPDIINGLRISRAPFMARALRRRFGTKTLPASKSFPIASMAEIIEPSIISCGATPLSRASWTEDLARGRLPL